MLTIHKFVFQVADRVEVVIPGFVALLDCQHQSSKPDILTLWAQVNTDLPSKVVLLFVRWTGQPIPLISYWKTVQVTPFDFVWHVFTNYQKGIDHDYNG